MKMTDNMIKNIICWKLVIVGVLTLGIPQAMGQGNSHQPAWEKWQPMAAGFMARRRVPEGLEKAKENRRPSSTQLHEIKKPGAKGKDRLKPGTSSSVWIYTGAEGLYSVTLTDLAAVTGIKLIQLRNAAQKGELNFLNADEPVSWYFDAARNRLLFTGEKYETFYAKGNAYQLQQSKKTDPQQMVEIDKSKDPVQAGRQTPFRETLQFEEEKDMMYFLWLYPSNPDARYCYWDYLYPPFKPNIEVPLYIPNPVDYGTARIRVQLHGFTDLYPGDDHLMYAELNGYAVGSVKSWDGLNPAEIKVDVDQWMLNADGNNILTLNSMQGGQILESISVTYDRLPVAENNQLWMRNVTAGIQEVAGLSSSDIFVIESPVRNSILHRDVNIYRGRDKKWAVSFEATEGSDYLIVEASALQSPALDGRQVENLTSQGNSADYLIIAPRDFSGTAQALADYREESYGTVNVVWLDDIYKSFSTGRVDPFAISRFMDYTRKQWAQAPYVVTLVGKGSIDRKDHMGYGDGFLPILMTANPWALAESDARLLGFENGVAPFAIGRLPITNDDEGLDYVDKLIEHERQLAMDGDQGYRAVVVSDNPDNGGNFHADSDQLATELSVLGFDSVIRLYHPTKAVRTNLTNSKTWSSGFISYSGHGGTTQVGNYTENFINTTDALALRNTTYSVFAALTCATGSDALPGTRSLAGALVLNPRGGAIAALASTGLSSNTDAHILNSAFIGQLYGEYNTVGGALVEAKQLTEGQVSDFMAPIYSIIGDPGVNVR